jgi:hypothetical protein
MTCGPVFFYWYYNRYQAKGLGPNASTRLVWKFFLKKYPIPGTCQGMKKGAKKKPHIRTSWVCSKVDTHQTLVCDGNCLILIVEREHFSSHQKTHISTSWVCSKLISVEHWLWRKMSESYCRKGTLLPHLTENWTSWTSWVCSKVDTLQMLVVTETGWFSLLKGNHSSSHWNSIIGRVGYVQKLIPIKHWTWQKTSDSHCRKGTLLITLKNHIRTSWVRWKVGCDRKCLILIVEREHSSFHQWGMAIQQKPDNSLFFIHVGTEVVGLQTTTSIFINKPIYNVVNIIIYDTNVWHSFKKKQNQQGIPYFVLPCS